MTANQPSLDLARAVIEAGVALLPLSLQRYAGMPILTCQSKFEDDLKYLLYGVVAETATVEPIKVRFYDMEAWTPVRLAQVALHEMAHVITIRQARETGGEEAVTRLAKDRQGHTKAWADVMADLGWHGDTFPRPNDIDIADFTPSVQAVILAGDRPADQERSHELQHDL
jgi:hypothetical protein